MTTQTLGVLVVLTIAAGYLARRVWIAVRAARAPKGGCGHDCGCAH